MYRVIFSFVFVGFLSVCGQHVQSPCPEYFDYRSDGSGIHGVINLKPFGSVSTLLIRANFTIATRLPSTYAGSIQPVGSELYLLQDFNRGVPLQYRVNFPVTSPLPKLVALSVNDNVICYGTGDRPGEASYITTISLQHMLFYKSGSNGLYEVYSQNPQTHTQQPTLDRPNVVYVIQPEHSQRQPNRDNINPVFEKIPNSWRDNDRNSFKPVIEKIPNFWRDNEEYPKETEAPVTIRTPRPTTPPTTQPTVRTTTERRTIPPRPPVTPVTLDSSSSMECGVNGDIQPLVYNGLTYDKGEWPWLVAIFKSEFAKLSYICAGTLISDRHVVTAAHCMKRKSIFTRIRNIVVKAGVHDLGDWGDDVTVTRTLSAAYIHDAYNASTLANDILVMMLDRTIPLSSYIKPACLWSGNTDLKKIIGEMGVVTGWGANEMGTGGKGEPRMVSMPIVSTATCRASKPDFHRLTSSKTLCAGDRNGAGPCLGDSGGGLYIRKDGRWRLRGVVSLSLKSESGESICNLEDYIVFTDAAQYLPWINEVMSNSDTQR